MDPYEYSFGRNLLEVKDLNVSYCDPNDESKMVPVLKNVNLAIKDILRPSLPSQGQVDALLSPSGVGKCLAKGTQVLMFDGSTKAVEEIVVGDKLMGPDSCPRNVLGLGHGIDEMFTIAPVKGEPYTVNESHILALKLTRDKRSEPQEPFIEISVLNYQKAGPWFKGRAKTYRVGVDFLRTEVPLDPYMFGLWLGDGDSEGFAITNEDAEVVDHILAFGAQAGWQMTPIPPNRYKFSANWNRKTAPTSLLKRLGVLYNKHIPQIYLANDRPTRLQVLAGIIDSDGSLVHSCYDVVQKSQKLAENIVFLARSLGLAAYSKPCQKSHTYLGQRKNGTYHRITISGDTDMIPVKIAEKRATPRKQIKNVLRSGFKVIPQGLGEYFGFELDGDGLFLLGDCTVTHNTTLFRCISGLQKPTSGTIQIAPNGGAATIPIHVGMVGVVAQEYPLFEHLTVEDNLMVAATIKSKDHVAAQKSIDEFLSRFLLDDKSKLYPHQLSGGQRQRVAIIQQMLCNNHLLLMDEPFSGLDILVKQKVQALISAVAAADSLNSVIVTTHDIQSAIAVADTILLLGRDRDVSGNCVPGAYIKHSYNLIELGLTWHPDVEHIPAFTELEHEIKARFKEL